MPFWQLHPNTPRPPNHQPLPEAAEIPPPPVLANTQLIKLADTVLFEFRKPHPRRAPAKLPLKSPPKPQPPADALLLMADSCVLGPNRHCHVRCRQWQRDIVIYRQNNQLFCRADEALSVDGAPATGNSEIQSGARVEGEDFSFAWEELM